MKKYRVSLKYRVSYYFDVFAKNKDSAHEIARETINNMKKQTKVNGYIGEVEEIDSQCS